MLKRRVISELLDHLPVDDPEALRSRRDLRRINGLMGNERWVLRAVARFAEAAGRGMVEVGAGDGLLSEKLARRYPQASVVAYDLAPRPVGLDARVCWEEGDIFEKPCPAGGVVVANLFLHHFERGDLRALGRWLGGFEVLIFNEPDRAYLPHGLGFLIRPWINRVTQHDMHVSITAGFGAGEMVDFLGLDQTQWHFEETWTWRGARRVIGWRD
jgi:hypothetical protein